MISGALEESKGYFLLQYDFQTSDTTFAPFWPENHELFKEHSQFSFPAGRDFEYGDVGS